MKGYATQAGYMGYVEGRYMLFASEEEYREFMEDQRFYDRLGDTATGTVLYVLPKGVLCELDIEGKTEDVNEEIEDIQ